VTNSGGLASGLTITDVLPANSNYVTGGTRVSGIVSWTLPSLSYSAAITRELVVTATQTITNSAYGVTASGGHGAVGDQIVVTMIP